MSLEMVLGIQEEPTHMTDSLVQLHAEGHLVGFLSCAAWCIEASNIRNSRGAFMSAILILTPLAERMCVHCAIVSAGEGAGWQAFLILTAPYYTALVS